MQNWDDLRYFLYVHQAGTMVSAARNLGANNATVSRRIERLGRDLGIQPFVKSHGNWIVNPALERLLMIVEDFDSALRSELNGLGGEKSSRQAINVRIGAPPFLLGPLLAPNIGAFKETNPGYGLEFVNRVMAEGLGDVDVLITDKQPDRGRLIIRRVGQCRFNAYAYPDSPKDGQWIGLVSEYEGLVPFQQVTQRLGEPPSLRTNTFLDSLELAAHSRLPVFLPAVVASRDPDLRLLDPEAGFVSTDFWIAYHESRKTDRAVIATAQWISSCFEKVHLDPDH